MHRIWVLFSLIITLSISSCNVKETVVFNEDGSGSFLVSYDMGSVMSQMKETFSDGASPEDSDEKEPGKVMDTTMVFNEILETYKDSIAALPEDKRVAFEAVKDMYMKMKMDEDNDVFDFGIGLDFKSIDDLKGIQERIEKAKTLNAQNGQVEAMKDGSPLGKFMGNDKNNVVYDFSETGFSRLTSIVVEDDNEPILIDETDPENKEFLDYFKNSFYTVEYKFPKKIKSISVEGAEISKDGKTVSYKSNWIDYLNDPKLLDVKVEFEDE